MRLFAHRAALAQALVCAIAVTAPAFAGQEMPALLDLYTAMPEPPPSPHDAATWFDASGNLVHPGLVALKRQIAAHKAGLVHQAKVAADDPPVVQAAAEAAQRAAIDQHERMGANQALWQTNEAAVQKISAVPLNPGRVKPAQQIGEGCDAPCIAAWDAYESALAAAQIARDGEVLALRRSAFAQACSDAAPFIREADTHLRATKYGDLSSSQHNKSLIQNLDGAALGEVEDLVSRLEAMASAAATTVRAQKAKARTMSSRQ